MIPASPAHRSSDAELWMFRRLKALSDEWVVYHSLGLIRHEHKPWSEVDFTLVGPEGVYLMEVKGGVVGRVNGEWQVRTAAGYIESLGRGPFQQVGGAEGATRKFLEGRMPWLRQTTFGYLVATPDCRLEVDDLGVDQNCVHDARHVDEPIDLFIRRLAATWHARTGRTGRLTAGQIEQVGSQLSQDVPMLADLRRVKLDVEQQMVALTLEQERAVADLVDNRALWLAGPAGSGKTLLAIGEVKRAARTGLRVGYCCHTTALAAHVRSLLETTAGSIEVLHRQQLVNEAAASAESSSHRWDLVVIDEAQDLMDGEFADLVDRSLVGGVASGRWRAFIDPNQSLFGQVDQRVVQRWLSTNPAIKRLSQNCRTTEAIALTVSALSGVPYAPGGAEAGPTPTITYLGQEAPAAEQVLERVRGMRNLGLDARDIVVLTPHRLASSVLSVAESAFVDFREEVVGGRVRHGTIGAFKGLEAAAVLIASVSEIDSVWMRQQLYVGCSRATTMLELVLPEALRDSVAGGYARASMALVSDGGRTD